MIQSSYRSRNKVKHRIKYWKKQNWLINNVKVIMISFIMLLVLIVTGTQLNSLSTELLIRDIELSGINYDVFRELQIGDGVLEQAQTKTARLLTKHPYLQTGSGIDPYAYLTFSMMARSYHLLEEDLVGEDLFLQGIGRIASKQGYQNLYQYYKAIFADIECFPIPRVIGDTSDVSYDNSWSDLRNYGGNRRHEGTDVMAVNNIRGYYPVISITDGTIEKMGWLEQGGYRIGVRSPSGGYFYYAHLYSYAPELKAGDSVIAGQLLGFMGDSGYGSEGTIGMFDVHLHLGIYVETGAGDMSVNPYYVLKILEDNRTNYAGNRSN